jgi:hypothetical protein
VTVSANRAGDGGAGTFTSPDAGRGGDGGGIYNMGTLTLERSNVIGNAAGNGGRAATNGLGSGGKGGDGGSGGGVANSSTAELIVVDTTLGGNHAGTGGAVNGGSDAGAGGAGGNGGGIFSSGTLSVSRSTLSTNLAGTGGTGGAGNTGGLGGAGGQGGGLFDAATTSQTIANDTIASNASGAGGAGGASIDSVPGGVGNDGGSGGGVVSAGAQLQIVHSTVAGNVPGAGGAGGAGSPAGPAGGPGGGGGVAAYGSAAARNTIFSHNGGSGCLGAVTDDGHNLSFPDATCPGTNADPKLGSLADNGGPTPTMLPGAGSAAIDRVPSSGSGCPASDQRGVGRPQGPGCDAGAVEVEVAPVNTQLPAIHAGSALTCSTGSWTNFPISYSYAWLRDGQLIAQANGARYVPQAADAGHHLACRVAARNRAGSASAQSGAMLIPGPRLSQLRLHPSAFKPGRGTTVSYRDTMAAKTTFKVLRSVSGVRVGHKCVKRGRGKRCTRLVSVGSFSRRDDSGANRFHFSGRVAGKPLGAGRYQLIAVAYAGIAHSLPLDVSFVVKR